MVVHSRRLRFPTGTAREVAGSTPAAETMTEEHYKEFRMARHVARVELRNAAAKYGAVVNRIARTTADRDVCARAARALEDAARAFAYADQLLSMADLEFVREARVA